MNAVVWHHSARDQGHNSYSNNGEITRLQWLLAFSSCETEGTTRGSVDACHATTTTTTATVSATTVLARTAASGAAAAAATSPTTTAPSYKDSVGGDPRTTLNPGDHAPMTGIGKSKTGAAASASSAAPGGGW